MKKLNFTDGTFLCLFEDEPTTKDLISYIPCCFLRSGNYSISKTDLSGNIYNFESQGNNMTVTINGVSKNMTSNGCWFSISGESNKIGVSIKNNTMDFPYVASDNNVNFQVNYLNGVGPSEYPNIEVALARMYAISKNAQLGAVANFNDQTAPFFNITLYGVRGDEYTPVPYSSFLGSVLGGDTQYGDSYNVVNLEATTEDIEVTLDTDPYAGAGESDTGGGDGTFDGSSDPVPVPPLPTVGATDAGFITLYAPTTTQLKNLAYTCWVGLLDDVWTNFRKLFSDPMDCILGLSVVPVSVPTSGVQDVAIGNIPTGVSMNVASQQYIEVDCGTVSFTKQSMNWHFGSYLDYEPYTKIAIYLPYVGVHQLNTDDIMGRTIQVVYHIDILTGSCIAFVKCGDSVLYQFNGACASNIPVNSLNYASTIENAIRIAVNIGTTVATAGASAPLSMAGEGISAGVRTAQNVSRGVSMAGATAEGALSMKPSIGRSGSLGGTTGLMGTQYPYLIITRPRLCKPKNQNFFKGYPSFIQTTVSKLIGSGYTEFDTIIIASSYLTDEEESELESIMKGGIYL